MVSDKAYDVEARVNVLAAASRQILDATSALTLSTSLQTVPGLSAVLAVGTYHYHAQLLINPGVTGGTMSYQMTASGGLVASDGRHVAVEMVGNNFPGMVDIPASTPALGTLSTSQTALGTANRLAFIDGIIVVSTAGTMNVQAKLSSGSGTIYQFGSYLQIRPVT